MVTILVRYLCWGCEAEKVVEEEIEENVDFQEIDRWNLCPSCIEKGKEHSENHSLQNLS